MKVNRETITFLALSLMLVAKVTSFHAKPQVVCTTGRAQAFRALFSSGKGFGVPPPPPKSPKQQITVESSSKGGEELEPPITVPAQMTAGQQSLAEMRRRKAEERDQELRKVKELIEMDKLVAEAPAAIPEKVAMRMGQRMLPLVGLPLFLGMGSFVAFWYLRTFKNMEFEPITVAVSTIGLLVVGLFGITYSIFSTSWDEDREGDLLGFEEAKRNLGNVREGLGRSRENAIIRERMAGLGEDEIERAIADLERRDAKNKMEN